MGNSPKSIGCGYIDSFCMLFVARCVEAYSAPDGEASAGGQPKWGGALNYFSAAINTASTPRISGFSVTPTTDAARQLWA